MVCWGAICLPPIRLRVRANPSELTPAQKTLQHHGVTSLDFVLSLSLFEFERFPVENFRTCGDQFLFRMECPEAHSRSLQVS